MIRLLTLLGVLCGLTAGGIRAAHAGDDDLAKELKRIKPLSPARALESFRIRPGFHVALAASEPLLTDPVSACYDADGRLYVVEMRGYPYPENTPSGNVRLLQDQDGDGRFESSTIFVDGLSWPTSVLPYDGGVFIVVPPRILYAKDTNGDGVADVNTTLFTGFGIQNVQALANGLLWGPDGWIYGVSGGNGGAIQNVTMPDAPAVDVQGRDFRFRPDGTGFEAISGGGQFGHAFDDWGHRFTCNNSAHVRQIVLPAAYLQRNSSLLPPAVIADIAAEGPAAPVYRISEPEPWRVVRTRQRVADPEMVKRLPPTERVAAGFFTSATGVTIYRGSAFGPAYRENVFVGDVGGNLVHRKVLSERGSIFQATRAEPDRKDEFLASPDTWFRPVNFTNTPSGTLLILDMYRETIEHPFSIPEPIKQHLDLTSGKDKGRLYEIEPDGFVRRQAPRLSKATTAELVVHLADPDAWWRETSQRLIVERNDPAAILLLKTMARDRPNARGRTHALWTLNILRQLDSQTLLPALSDPEPRVREQALKQGEALANSSPAVADGMLGLANDPDSMVRFQAAFSLGAIMDPRVSAALASIASRDRADPWVRVAVLSSIADRLGPFINGLRNEPDFYTSADGRAWLMELAELAGHGGNALEIQPIVLFASDAPAPIPARLVALIGLDRGLRHTGKVLKDVLKEEQTDGLASLFRTARETAVSEAGAQDLRLDAIRVIGLDTGDHALEVLPTLLDARQPIEIQRASLQTLGGLSDDRVVDEILSHWKSFGPSVRPEAIEILFSTPERLNRLLDALEVHEFAANDLDSVRRDQLRKHGDPRIRERAAKLFGAAVDVNREQAIAAARPALSLSGVAENGRALFDRVCAACHRAEGRGERIGPELATVTGRSPDDLLTHILDPNREVPPQYVNYILATTDGQVLTGRILAESANAVTLGRAGGVTEVVPRSRIDALSSTGLSVMPEGLEDGLSHQDLADLIAFLRALKPEQPPE